MCTAISGHMVCFVTFVTLHPFFDFMVTEIPHGEISHGEGSGVWLSMVTLPGDNFHLLLMTKNQ
jgi:hypothetical protein